MKKKTLVNLILIAVALVLIAGSLLYAKLAANRILSETIQPDPETIASVKAAQEEREAALAASEITTSVSAAPLEESAPAELPEEEIAAEPVETPKPSAEFIKGSYEDLNSDHYMDYYVYVPAGAADNMPLVVFLHGDGYIANLESLKTCGPVEKVQAIYGDEFPFIMLLPCTREASWQGWISEVLKGLIDETITEYNIDKDHVIITGHSRGAIGTWSMVSDYANYFSAAVPVSGATDIHSESFENVPVWAICGECIDDYDTYYDWMKYQIEKINNAGGDGKITIIIDANHQDTESEAYTEEVFTWMLEQ